MKCLSCGGEIFENEVICPHCGSIVEKKQDIEDGKVEKQEVNKSNNANKNRLFIVIGVCVLLIIFFIVIITLNSGPSKRAKTISKIEKNDYLKFSIGDEIFYLGDATLTYQKKNYSFENDYFTGEERVYSDSISVQPFYNNDESKFLAALYCAKTEDCTYDESIVVKVNFYENKDLVVNDFLKFGMKYDEVVEKYGKEDGTFYQDNSLLVWTFGGTGKVGEPYYILRFDNYGILTKNELIDIRVGIWWYDGEYERTLVKEEGSES